MLSGINALVVGAGYFGRHHARIISELNAKNLPKIPFIEKLIVTRTTLDRAKEVVQSIRSSSGCSVRDVIGAEVGNWQQLAGVLEKYRPAFTSITARDKITGDSIHSEYTVHALKYGTVLCEKPFSHACGDGSSLRHFNELYGCENAKFFGFELPLAVVSRKMTKDRKLRRAIRQARRFEFYWEAWDRGENRIIEDLVLHPWSLIPQTFKTEIRRVDDRGTRADLLINLFDRQTERDLSCKIILKIGPGFRGLMVDDLAIAIKNKASLIQLINLNQPLERAAKTGIETRKGKVILEVDNPLEQNILAVLRRQPIVGLRRTYESQLFLEALHGYQG